jgi:hypothetical protein
MKEDKETFDAEMIGDFWDCLHMVGHNKERRALIKQCIQAYVVI